MTSKLSESFPKRESYDTAHRRQSIFNLPLRQRLQLESGKRLRVIVGGRGGGETGHRVEDGVLLVGGANAPALLVLVLGANRRAESLDDVPLQGSIDYLVRMSGF